MRKATVNFIIYVSLRSSLSAFTTAWPKRESVGARPHLFSVLCSRTYLERASMDEPFASLFLQCNGAIQPSRIKTAVEKESIDQLAEMDSL